MSEKTSSWDDAASWYKDAVGEKGHYYHQAIVIPNILKMLKLKKGDSLLDLGCGQGVFARSLPKEIFYVGVDLSKKLIQEAQKITRPECNFYVKDVTKPLDLEKKDFDIALFLLSLQNMKEGSSAIAQAKAHLKSKGRLLLVLNHPCFRIPRQSSWEIDEKSKIQYRRVNRYISSMEIPIQVHPGRGKDSEMTYSFHHSLSDISSWLFQNGFLIEKIEEWCSDKMSTGSKARMENLARKEFPLFLSISAILAS